MKLLYQTGEQKLRAKHKNEPKKTPISTRTVKLMLIPIIFVVIFKLLFSFITAYKPSVTPPEFNLTPDVSAQEQTDNQPAQTAPPEPAQPETPENSPNEDKTSLSSYQNLDWDPSFIEELKVREDNVKRRELSLELQEQHLLKLKRQIEESIEELEKVEKNISKLLAQKEQIENEKLKKLAKVFEATPPEQAGTLMSQLEVDIAAQLLLNMTGRKAGKIWGYVDPESAVKISKRLSELKPDFKIGTTPTQTEE